MADQESDMEYSSDNDEFEDYYNSGEWSTTSYTMLRNLSREMWTGKGAKRLLGFVFLIFLYLVVTVRGTRAGLPN